MRPSRRLWLLLLTTGWVVELGAEPRTQSAAAAPAPAVVTLLGASVTAGFTDPRPPAPDAEPNQTVSLRAALAPLWSDRAVHLRDRSETLTFLDPIKLQTRALRGMVRDSAALVVGIDLPFWFGYGQFGDPDPTAARLDRQARGLALLDGIEAPLLLGDYPDMRGADTAMLPPEQIPTTEQLVVLNAALSAWAAARPRVMVFPLAAHIATARDSGVPVSYRGDEIILRDELWQSDRLHPTRLGVAVLAHRVAGFLREHLPEDSPLRPREVTFEELVEAAGATVAMEDALEAAARARMAPTEAAPDRDG